MDRDKLKIEALLERLSEITRMYEDKDAERRVEITLLSKQLQDVTAELESLRADAQED